MKRKINLTLSLIALFAVIASTIGVTLVSYNLFEKQVRSDLRIDAELLKDSEIFDEKNRIIDDDQFELVTSEKLRITWIDSDGTVLFDNDTDASRLENHKDRPEIIKAFDTGSGESVRTSDTFQINTYYYAIKLDNGTVVRSAIEAKSISSVFIASLPAILCIAFAIMVICLLISSVLTRQILDPIERMAENINREIIGEIEYQELKPFADKIRSQHENIIKAARSRQDFTANVSHELKTPLTAISGYAELIENHMVEKDREAYFASQIHANADRLVNLINEIIKLSELDHKEMERDFENTDIFKLTSRVCEEMQVNARKRNVELICQGSSIVRCVESNLISELVRNLVQNAITYNREGGHVEVRVTSRDGRAELHVKDNGIGIPADCLEHIFERFYRVDKSRSRERGGTGLGLAIVKHIAEIHDAEISIDSSLGEGTEISVLI